MEISAKKGIRDIDIYLLSSVWLAKLYICIFLFWKTSPYVLHITFYRSLWRGAEVNSLMLA